MSLQNKSGLGLVVLGIFMGYVGATLTAAPLSGFLGVGATLRGCPSGVFVVATLAIAINKVV